MSFFTFKHVPPSATSGHWILGLLCGCLCGHPVPLVSPVRTRPAGRKHLVRYNCSSRTLGAGFLLTLPPGTASSLLWVGQSGGCAYGGSFMRIQGSPSFCRPACVWWRDHGGAIPGNLPPPPRGGGRSSWQLAPAGWLQAEVMLVSWTDSLLQGRRANQVLRQMEPRPAFIYPKGPPTLRSVKRTTSPSVRFSPAFFPHVSHLKMKNNLWLWVEHFLGCLLSFITTDRLSACSLSCVPRCSEPAQDLLTSSLSRVQWRWIHFSFWRKNILTLSYGEAVLLLRKLKWVQHEIILIPSKHALSLLSRAGGRVGKVQLRWRLAALLFFVFFLLPSPILYILPTLHFSTSLCPIFFQSALWNCCDFKITKKRYHLHRNQIHYLCVNSAEQCGDAV